MVKRRRVAGALLCVLVAAAPAGASSIGHYLPGLFGVRDYFVPPEGWYGSFYTEYYAGDTFKDRNGSRVESLTVPTRRGPVAADVSANADLVIFVPILTYSSPWKVFGGRWAAAIAPSFSNANLSASISGEERGFGGPGRKQLAWSDLYVEPVRLGWHGEHWEGALAYGFYAPTGKYHVNSRTVGPIVVEGTEPQNTGLGFWTNQAQQAGAWYPMDNKGTALMLTMTEEVHGEKRFLDDKPGAHVTLNWGLSQMLPLNDEKLLLEAAPIGYLQWQVTDDAGADASNGTTHSRVFAAGVHLALVYVPRPFVFAVRYLNEFSARSRIAGQVVSGNVSARVW